MDTTAARDAVAAALAEIAPEVDLAACDAAAPLAEELDLDSMDLLNLAAALGDRLGFELPDGDVDPSWSLDELVAHVAAASAG